MRTRPIAAIFASAVGMAAIGANAQAPTATPLEPPVPRPTVSPYLSLLNRNNSMAFNYYELYRPQRRFQQAYEQLGTDLNRLEGRVERGLAPGQTANAYRLGATGHPTSFMNYGSYFPSGQR